MLSKAKNCGNPYQNIDEVTRNDASKILDEYKGNTDNVIGVDIKSGDIYISRWER